MHTTVVFTQCGSFASIDDTLQATFIFDLIEDGQSLGLFSVSAKSPPGSGVLMDDLLEVPLPQQLGSGPHGKPHIAHQRFRDAVVAYMLRVLWNLHEHPGDPHAFEVRWVVEFDSDPATDEAGW